MSKYPYLLAWEHMNRSSKFYTDDQLALAIKENAPHDAMWRGLSGKWHCFSEMRPHNPNRALLEAYVWGLQNPINKGVEDETV